MVQRVYLKKITVAKEHNWFFTCNEKYNHMICKITVARSRNRRDYKQLCKECKQCIKST